MIISWKKIIKVSVLNIHIMTQAKWEREWEIGKAINNPGINIKKSLYLDVSLQVNQNILFQQW